MRASGDRARRCPCALRDLFGLNFVFLPAFQPVLPAYAGFFVLLLNGGDTVIHAVMLCGNFILLAFDDFASAFLFTHLGIV